MQEEVQKTEVRETTTQNGGQAVERQTVRREEHTSGAVVAKRVVWFVAGLITIIIALRFVFLLLGANQGAAFTDLVYSLSAPFVAPFVGIFGEPTYGQSVFDTSSLLAIAIYLLIAWGIARLLTIGRPQRDV